jgi:hypothetical protein
MSASPFQWVAAVTDDAAKHVARRLADLREGGRTLMECRNAKARLPFRNLRESL